MISTSRSGLFNITSTVARGGLFSTKCLPYSSLNSARSSRFVSQQFTDSTLSRFVPAASSTRLIRSMVNRVCSATPSPSFPGIRVSPRLSRHENQVPKPRPRRKVRVPALHIDVDDLFLRHFDPSLDAVMC